MSNRITRIETLRPLSRTSLIWVLVHTSDGVCGLGESWFGSATVEADIHNRIAPLLLGENASAIEQINHLLRPYTGFCGSGAER